MKTNFTCTENLLLKNVQNWPHYLASSPGSIQKQSNLQTLSFSLPKVTCPQPNVTRRTSGYCLPIFRETNCAPPHPRVISAVSNSNVLNFLPFSLLFSLQKIRSLTCVTVLSLSGCHFGCCSNESLLGFDIV